ncbi:unnamed protein product [Rhizoctonia solani]|uniref:Uncharacterized protein n=1 Tax=Rhizoctonia solani TaxID=456999 RepID=A0A8H3AS52_9AGAM|nr:unnamed protein product [Rhizoctonia solani]
MVLGGLFRKKETEFEVYSDDSPAPPLRPRFRRTKSAASESIYADYESDDWGDADTIHVDRDGHPVHTHSYDDDLEDWQHGGGGQGIMSRMRSLSISRPNRNRAPPTTYGWTARVERAGGVDEAQLRREEERSHRPVTIPVPNPAPGPINVQGGVNPPGVGEAPPKGVPLQPPALVRRNTVSSNRPSERVREERSATSSPKVIDHKDIRKKGPQDMIGSLKPGQLGAYTRRRHLSRVEKIAAVIQHVTSLPFMADSPVNTYYPAKEKETVPPAEPYHVFNPTVPKRYLPPPPMAPSWYQPKPPKLKKVKQPKKSKKPDEGDVAIVDDRGFPLGAGEDEFTYPDYYQYSNDPYTGDTPTLQSDFTTSEDSESFYDHPRLIQDMNYTDLPVRPAYFPAPIKSTGLSTVPQHNIQPRPLPITDAAYHDDDYSSADYSSADYSSATYSSANYSADYSPTDYTPTDYTPTDYTSTRSSRELGSSFTEYDQYTPPSHSQHARIPLAITYPVPPPASSSAVTAPGPPLVIPSPHGQPKTKRTPAAKLGPLPGGYSPLEQPFGKNYDAHVPSKGKKRSSKTAAGPSPRSKHGPSPQALYEPAPYGYGPPLRPPSNMKVGPSPQVPFGVSPQFAYDPPPPAAYGPSPGTAYDPSPNIAYGFPYKPSPQPTWGPSPHAPYGKPPKGTGPSPQTPYGFPQQTPYGPSPQTAYGRSPQVPYDPGMYGVPVQDQASHQYAFHARVGTPTYVDPIKDQYVWGWGAREIGPDGLPLPPPIPGESPPPIPSPIATVTSLARSRNSRRG